MIFIALNTHLFTHIPQPEHSSSDISVLQTMLAQEGLTNQAGPSKQDIEPLHM